MRNLELQWVFQTRGPAEANEKFEATPLVVDGVMYTVLAPNHVVALDAATGTHVLDVLVRDCRRWRASAAGASTAAWRFSATRCSWATIDGHLIAIDAKTGKPIWDKARRQARQLGYSFTLAPLVVKDKVIVGPAGGEYGIRGFIAAFDAATATRPGASTRSRDPASRARNLDRRGEDRLEDRRRSGVGDRLVRSELNLTYWGTGNPGPDWNGDPRPGDNLYTDSVIALDADTGQLKWHYQFTPHDEFDYDATQVPVLVDMTWQGQPRKLMLWANRNGFWYVLDRTNGQFLQGKPFTKVNWANGFDREGPAEAGARIRRRKARWSSRTTRARRTGTPPSYSPRTGLFYIPSWMDTFSTVLQGAGRVQGRQPVRRAVPDHGVPGAAPRARGDQPAAA